MNLAQSPWQEICSARESYLLSRDRVCVQQHNANASDPNTKFILESIPEPFIGSPHSARVILLGKNPGHSDDDPSNHRNASFRNAMIANLCHEDQSYPFYPLNPAFKETGAGKWWRQRTREIRKDSGLSDLEFSRKLMVIEWFPYHSIAFSPPKKKFGQCGSQAYSSQLAKMMFDENRLVVRMRGQKEWAAASDKFASIDCLRNPQSGYITRGNMDGDLYDRFLLALKA